MREYIIRRSEQEGGRPPASRQNLKSIEICFNSSHRGKIALYLDGIHQYLCAVKFCKNPSSNNEVIGKNVQIAHGPMGPIAHVPHGPCAPLPMCPMAHLPHCPCAPLAM